MHCFKSNSTSVWRPSNVFWTLFNVFLKIHKLFQIKLQDLINFFFTITSIQHILDFIWLIFEVHTNIKNEDNSEFFNFNIKSELRKIISQILKKLKIILVSVISLNVCKYFLIISQRKRLYYYRIIAVHKW